MERKEMTCFAGIFMIQPYCNYIIFNLVLFGHLKYLLRAITLYLLQFLPPSWPYSSLENTFLMLMCLFSWIKQ